MHKHIVFVMLELANAAGGVAMGGLAGVLPWWGWAAVSGTALLIAIGVYWHEAKQGVREVVHGNRFDVPIRDAIHHAVATTDHSYMGSGAAERHFFDVLHRQMCEGKLPVKGRLGEYGDFRRLSRRECRRLVPQEVVVPLSPTSPNGVLFSLIDAELLESLQTAMGAR